MITKSKSEILFNATQEFFKNNPSQFIKVVNIFLRNRNRGKNQDNSNNSNVAISFRLIQYYIKEIIDSTRLHQYELHRKAYTADNFSIFAKEKKEIEMNGVKLKSTRAQLNFLHYVCKTGIIDDLLENVNEIEKMRSKKVK
jgi:hypothetical protein